MLDGRLYDDGAVGVLVPPGHIVEPLVSQGCRPLGEPMIVTRAERNIVYELAGKPALERVVDLAAAATPEDRALLQAGLHIGVVVDEAKDEFERGDFLVRAVLGADRSNGAMAIGQDVEVGTTIQFHVRDADSADEDLRAMLARPARPRPGWCSRAPGAARTCSAGRTTTPSWSRRSPAAAARGCSAPARSVRSGAAASCTASPRRSPSSAEQPQGGDWVVGSVPGSSSGGAGADWW